MPDSPLPTIPDPSILTVYIRDPERVYFEGKVIAVSSMNTNGPFDILGEHENFISIIKDKLLLNLPDGTKKDIPITQGILKAQKNTVYIFLSLASMLGKTT